MPAIDLAEATASNSSFSRLTPGLQLAVDSTSLGAFKTCQRLYYYTHILGYQPRQQSVHLTFGILMHEGREKYYVLRAGGKGHEEALRLAVHWALRETWDSELHRPKQWGDKVKNRISLVRTLIWYLDRYGQDDPLETVILSNGRPAVELSFRFSPLLNSQKGEYFLLCGHIDRLGKLNGVTYISDLKTTGHSLDQRWFDQFSPDNQFSTYMTAGRIVFEEEMGKVDSLIVDGVQVLANGSRFMRGLVTRPPGVLEEWWDETMGYLKAMEQSAIAGHWPMNDKACGMYGGCAFRGVCAKSPAARRAALAMDFQRRVWDPLQVRGDI